MNAHPKELKDLQIGDFVEFVTNHRNGDRQGDIVLSDSAKWFCTIVRPSCHQRAELDLGRIGYRTFYPKTRKWAAHARVKRAVERPILGRYLFVEVDHPRQSFASIRSLFDIESMVSNLGRPTPFPSHWVEGLLSRYMAGEWDEIAQGKIPVGARIRIIEGEFADKFATVTGVKGQRVDMKLLGENRYTKMNQCSIRAA